MCEAISDVSDLELASNVLTCIEEFLHFFPGLNEGRALVRLEDFA